MSRSKHSPEFRAKVSQEYMDGAGSIRFLVDKYGISYATLRGWIKVYNANRELKDYNPKQEVYMAEARRKTTLEERKEIVNYCINHNRDYKNTAAKFDVSYSQVYNWVKKYDANGESGLTDKRGHHKTDDEVDELERLRRENLRLKRQLEEKDMVVELLKKVKEFEWMCKHLEISRAAYYKWLHREAPDDELENIKLAELIREYDERFNHILGYRRMTSWLNHFNHTKYSKNRVHRIMKKLGIHSVIRKKKKKI